MEDMYDRFRKLWVETIDEAQLKSLRVTFDEYKKQFDEYTKTTGSELSKKVLSLMEDIYKAILVLDNSHHKTKTKGRSVLSSAVFAVGKGHKGEGGSIPRRYL